MIIYNKAVRDKIPQIIEREGKICDVKILPTDEFLAELNTKLAEELQEYMAGNEIAELADLVEVVYGILAMRGVSNDEFEQIRMEKKRERGGFSERKFLVSVSD